MFAMPLTYRTAPMHDENRLREGIASEERLEKKAGGRQVICTVKGDRECSLLCIRTRVCGTVDVPMRKGMHRWTDSKRACISNGGSDVRAFQKGSAI